MSTSPIYSQFLQAARRHPERLALVIGETTRRYDELAGEVSALAANLKAAGVKPGEHIGIILPNCLAFVQLMLAAAGLGAVLVPLPLSSTHAAIRKAFASTAIRHCICWHAATEARNAATASDGLRLCVGGETQDWLGFEPLTRDVVAPLEDPTLPEHLPYLILLTSGSTGAPKPIQLSQAVKLGRASSAISLYGLGENEVVLAATPLHHSLAQRLVLIPLISGGTSVVLERYTPTAWLEAIDRYGVTFTMAVSTQLKQITPLLDRQSALSSLRCLVSSSATLDAETKGLLLSRTACAFHEIYGTSEVASVTNLSVRDHPRKLQSVGQPIQGIDIVILGQDGQLCPPGLPGEILCRTPLAFDGYYNQPEATQAAHWQGYFRTGDLGTIDDEGFLYFLGRIKDIVIVGGINVYPRDIEEIVEGFPNVAEAAAIAVDDPDLGEVVGLVVAPKNPAIPVDKRALLRHCANRLNDAQIPRHIFQLSTMPRNEMGKIDKPTLRIRFFHTEKGS